MNLENEITKINKKLKGLESRIEKLESFFEQNKEKPNKEINIDIKECLGKLSKASGIEEDKLKNIFYFEKDGLKILSKIKGKKESEKQLKATVSILTVYYYCYGIDKIKATDLTKQLEWLKISLANLSRSLSSNRKYLILKGRSRKDYSYEITFPGRERGLEIIKELSYE
jgi:hypothetical protein